MHHYILGDVMGLYVDMSTDRQRRLEIYVRHEFGSLVGQMPF